jgi:hypothetical protein
MQCYGDCYGDGSSHWYILFELRHIRQNEQDGIVVEFAERRAGEGFVCIAEVRVAVVESISPACRAINMLIEFR